MKPLLSRRSDTEHKYGVATDREYGPVAPPRTQPDKPIPQLKQEIIILEDRVAPEALPVHPFEGVSLSVEKDLVGVRRRPHGRCPICCRTLAQLGTSSSSEYSQTA